MLISKENAEKIAQISYKLFEMGKTKTYMTYKKAMELDEQTGEKILQRAEKELEIAEMYEEAKSLGAKLHHGDSEIITIDNYQYVESISYDVIEDANIYGMDITGLELKMLKGESISIPNLSTFYAPHIYGHMLRSKYNNSDYPKIDDPSMRAVYFKSIISEDRRINPFVIREGDVLDKYRYSFCFPMEEAIREATGFDDEIDLLNDLFKLTNGRFFSEGKLGGYADISIKPTVLYLEGIDEIGLANRFREYDRDDRYQYLNMLLDYANKGYFGVTFNGTRKQINLL